MLGGIVSCEITVLWVNYTCTNIEWIYKLFRNACIFIAKKYILLILSLQYCTPRRDVVLSDPTDEACYH